MVHATKHSYWWTTRSWKQLLHGWTKIKQRMWMNIWRSAFFVMVTINVIYTDRIILNLFCDNASPTANDIPDHVPNYKVLTINCENQTTSLFVDNTTINLWIKIINCDKFPVGLFTNSSNSIENLAVRASAYLNTNMTIRFLEGFSNIFHTWPN